MAYGAILGQTAPPSEAGVTSFNGRTGEVVPQEGDYTAEQVGAIGLNKLTNSSTYFFKLNSTYYKIVQNTIGNGVIIFLETVRRTTDFTTKIIVRGVILLSSGSTYEGNIGTIYNLETNVQYKPKSIFIKNITGDLSDITMNSKGKLNIPSSSVQGIGYFELTYDNIL